MVDEEKYITPALIRRFELESEYEGGPSGRYCALLPRASGDLLSHHPASLMPEPQQVLWAMRVLNLLNRELHHDGTWVIVFTHPKPPQSTDLTVLHNVKHFDYARYCLLWLDKDADVQFTMEWSEGAEGLLWFTDVVLAGIESTAQKAEAAWQQWHMLMRLVLDPQPNQLYRRAKGEKAPTAH